MLSTLLLMSALAVPGPEASVLFDRQKIGTTTFEAASIFDVNNDGHIDLVSGATYTSKGYLGSLQAALDAAASS